MRLRTGIRAARPATESDRTRCCFGQARTLGLQIGARRGKERRVIPESAEANIARIAEQASDVSCSVIVVNSHRDPAVAVGAADCASTALLPQQILVLREAQAVQVPSESPLRPFVLACATLPRSSSRVDVAVLRREFVSLRTVGYTSPFSIWIIALDPSTSSWHNRMIGSDVTGSNRKVGLYISRKIEVPRWVRRASTEVEPEEAFAGRLGWPERHELVLSRVVALVLSLLTACAGPSAAPTATPTPLGVVELKYRVFEQIGRPWYCDPDFYPIARADERDLARERLPEMQRDAETYGAILRHTGVAPGVALTDDQLLAVYRDWKQLRALELRPVGDVYGFNLLVQSAAGAKEGTRVDARILPSGQIVIIQRVPAGPPICPICLAATSWIDTPVGPIALADVRPGMLVWTLNESGRRVAAPVLEVGSMEAAAGHDVVRATLEGGRTVTASPGHPLADGRPIGALRSGDRAGGVLVLTIERLPYAGRTYDLRPAGSTGAYFVDGVALGTTIRVPSARPDAAR